VATMQAIFDKGIASVPTTTTPPSTEAPTTTVKPTTTPPPTAAPTTPAPTPAPPTAAPPTEAPVTKPPTTPAPTEAPTTVKATTTTVAPVTVMSVLRSTPQFSEFAAVVTATGVDAQLSADTPMTLFAPTNDALSPDDVARLSGDRNAVLQYLVPNQSLLLSQLNDGLLPNAGGSSLVIDTTPTLTVNGVAVSVPDVAAGKGTIQGLADALP